MNTRRESVHSPLSEEECRKEWFKLFTQFSSSRSLPPVKNASITEAETVSAGTKFIRDTAQQEMGEHIEKQFV